MIPSLYMVSYGSDPKRAQSLCLGPYTYDKNLACFMLRPPGFIGAETGVLAKKKRGGIPF